MFSRSYRGIKARKSCFYGCDSGILEIELGDMGGLFIHISGYSLYYYSLPAYLLTLSTEGVNVMSAWTSACESLMMGHFGHLLARCWRTAVECVD